MVKGPTYAVILTNGWAVCLCEADKQSDLNTRKFHERVWNEELDKFEDIANASNTGWFIIDKDETLSECVGPGFKTNEVGGKGNPCSYMVKQGSYTTLKKAKK